MIRRLFMPGRITRDPPAHSRKYATNRGAVLDIRRSADGLVEVSIWTVTG